MKFFSLSLTLSLLSTSTPLLCVHANHEATTPIVNAKSRRLTTQAQAQRPEVPQIMGYTKRFSFGEDRIRALAETNSTQNVIKYPYWYTGPLNQVQLGPLVGWNGDMEYIYGGDTVGVYSGAKTRLGTFAEARVIPPDQVGDVSEEHVVQMSNAFFIVADKQGGVLMKKKLDTFWEDMGAFNCTVRPGCSFDPRVYYDGVSERWFAVSVDSGSDGSRKGNNVLIGVSKNSNPLEGWWGYAVVGDPSRGFFDFPTLGVNRDWVFIGGNIFPEKEAPYISAILVPKSSLMLQDVDIKAKTMLLINLHTSLNIPSEFMTPMTYSDPQSNEGFTIVLTSGAQPSQTKRNYVMLKLVPNYETFMVEARVHAINLPYTYSAPLSGRQPESDEGLSSGTAWLKSELKLDPIRNLIWGCHSVKGTRARNAIRVFALDKETRQIATTKLIDGGESDYLYPSISVAGNTILIGITKTSKTEEPGVYVVVGNITTVKVPFNPITVTGEAYQMSFMEPFLVQAGTKGAKWTLADDRGRIRWGDYTSTVVDRYANEYNEKGQKQLSFWTFQEYLQGNENYGTMSTNIVIAFKKETLVLPSSPTAFPSSAPTSSPTSFEFVKLTHPPTASLTPSLSPSISSLSTLSPSPISLTVQPKFYTHSHSHRHRINHEDASHPHPHRSKGRARSSRGKVKGKN